VEAQGGDLVGTLDLIHSFVNAFHFFLEPGVVLCKLADLGGLFMFAHGFHLSRAAAFSLRGKSACAGENRVNAGADSCAVRSLPMSTDGYLLRGSARVAPVEIPPSTSSVCPVM
jgi:hypothetical protein